MVDEHSLLPLAATPNSRAPDSIFRTAGASDRLLGFQPEPLSRPIVVRFAGLFPQAVSADLNEAESLIVANLRVGGSDVLYVPLSRTCGVRLALVMWLMRRFRRHFVLSLSNTCNRPVDHCGGCPENLLKQTVCQAKVSFHTLRSIMETLLFQAACSTGLDCGRRDVAISDNQLVNLAESIEWSCCGGFET
jgi:hypothetical protein